jgi:ribosomal protein L11 methyltransferase
VLYPALDVHYDEHDLVLALVDDCSPTAAEEHAGRLTIFFPDRVSRDRAQAAIARTWPQSVATARDVDDEDWARRSQQNLQAITVGRITILPTGPLGPPQPDVACNAQSPIALVIEPSMGFGTGHHATTRLCLRALQTIDLSGAFVLDIGTGSGVLAIAARLLGAATAVGIDHDPDAVQAANANLSANPLVDRVRFAHADLTAGPLPSTPGMASGDRTAADVVTANLTGALLAREATRLAAALAPCGSMVASGLLEGERDEVVAAFEGTAGLRLVWELNEDGWMGLLFAAAGLNHRTSFEV